MLRSAHDVVVDALLAFEQEVSLADGVGLGVDFLPVEVSRYLCLPLGGEVAEGFFRDGEHSASAECAVVEQVGARFYLVRDRPEYELCHEFNGVTGGPVLPGFLVVLLVEATRQVLEDGPHGVVV